MKVESNMTYQIFVKDPYNKTWVLPVDMDTMPMDCFRLVSDRLNNNNRLLEIYNEGKLKFKLIYNGKLLNNFESLLDQNVEKESTLHMKLVSIT